ncbi:MAG: MarR family transcriptional regulator [Saprospiraceae bacterium]
MITLTEFAKTFDFQEYYAIRDRSMGRLMWRLKRYMHDFVEPRLESCGFGNFQMSYLSVLGNLNENGVTTTELARRTGVTKQAMSKVVKLLEEQGYVYIQAHEKDARSSVIFLSQRGMELLTTIYHVMNELKRKFGQIIGAEEVERLADTMLRLVQALEQEGPPRLNLNDQMGC